MDVLIRYHRMKGRNTLWQMGTDHAGIATQIIVERQLLAKNILRKDLTREEFIEHIWQWKKTSGSAISKQLRRLGASVEWSRERFTMDEGLSKAVQTVFIQLYREGLIYKGQRLVNWDPVLKTAVSDLEVNAEEEAGNLWHICYPIADSNESLTIATTRPETMLGDTAVAVNPNDSRYKHLIGKKVKLPIANRTIPIIADDYVDPEFGSGCLKITPGHDFNDYEVGLRHKLPIINILTADAKINGNSPKDYVGMDRFDARNKIIEELKNLNLLEKIEPHALKIPRGERTKTVIEPYLTKQWFVKIAPLAKPAIDAVKSGKIKFVPENWANNYFEWMYNIQDWCISRQLWWGHRIPAWYDKDGNIYVGRDLENVYKYYNLSSNIELEQDEDVLDTWFSAALWPFSTLGWPKETKEFNTFYPTNVLVTGFDIIFFWVARMIMFGLKFTNQVPFHTVYINGIIQDQDGQKMSKFKGNVLDPLDFIDGIGLNELIAKRIADLDKSRAKEIEQFTRKQFPKGITAYGTDALRFTFCSLATTSRHVRFDLARIESYRNFCNKLWNATRYVLMNTEDYTIDLTDNNKTLNLADKWIFSIWQKTKAAIIEHIEKYRFDLLTQEIYEFTWNEYCDWYLELSKPILYGNNVNDKELDGTRYTLLYILEELLRVIHPVMPFITEELWQMLAIKFNKQGQTLITHSFPEPDLKWQDNKAEETVKWLKDFIVGIRNIRGEMNISQGKLLPVVLANASKSDQTRIDTYASFLQSLAKIESFDFLDPKQELPPAATALVGEMKILIPMQGLIDQGSETTRLKKEINKLQKELQRSEAKLTNPNYTEKAPANIIAKERAKFKELQDTINKLNDSLKVIANI